MPETRTDISAGGLRAAVRWLRDNHPWTPQRIEEAAQRFNLSPRDEEFLLREFRDKDGDPGRES